ncbi:MAG: GNAT family N-acetyltransferase [Desulfuromonadales bacterium]|nr:GNAT family N-acetyltransferase [Desulfuromonadales bacterium]
MTDGIANNKIKFNLLCNRESSIPIFLRNWWLDAVCGPENWDVVLYEKGERIFAVLPYYKKTRYGLKLITMPRLTPFMGAWLTYPENQKHVTKMSYEKECYWALIDQLPKVNIFLQYFPPAFTNWLPFRWKGFEQTTVYTYAFEELTDLDKIWNGMQENIRREIRKAKKQLIVKTGLDLDRFLEINSLSFSRQHISFPVKEEIVRSVDVVCSLQNRRIIFYAEDEHGRIHAAVYIVWDENSAYYLMGGGDAALRNSGAHSLLMWESIRFASQVTLRFDFEGSMYEPIERFFRAFGARQIPIFCLMRSSPWMKLLLCARDVVLSLKKQD